MRASPLIAMGLLSLLFGCGPREGPWARRDGVWYYRDVQVAETDGDGFEALDDHYARDRRRVFHGDSFRDGREYFLVRHDRVVVLEGADPASFRLLPGPGGERGYARDERRAYFEGELFPVRDLATLQILGDSFARDAVTGYYMQKPVPGSHGRTFEGVDSHYARDTASVFYCDIPYDRVAATPPGPRTVVLPGADPATFRVLADGYATDAKQVYWNAKVVSRHPASFTTLGHDYARTETAILYRGEVVQGADVASFTTDAPMPDSADAKDRHGTYWLGKKQQQPPSPRIP